MIRSSFWILPLVSVLLVNQGNGVDKSNFKTCEQSSFCRRCRGVEPGKSSYELRLNTLHIEPTSLQAELINSANSVKFRFQLFALADGTFRVKVNEWAPRKPRYEVEFALDGEPTPDKLEVVERTGEHITVQSGDNRAKVFASPFHMELYSGEQLVISANARGLMRFEHLRLKAERLDEACDRDPAPVAAPSVFLALLALFLPYAKDEGEDATGGDDVTEDDTASDPGAWEENFKSHHDSKPDGPTAVAMDFSFPGAHHAYGIPEHADSFALKSTKSTDPYRLYNLDVFEYELNNPMALYGSVPFLVAHSASRTAGVFWLNAAETWVDVHNTADQNVVSSIVNFVSGSAVGPQVDTHFMSESGIVDVFFVLGPQPKDVFRQYARLTGTAPLPPLFSLAYHQSRWNYNDQDDVRNVDNGFDEHDLPMDVMWLDIEYTDAKKYFTWDRTKFPQPTEMMTNLTAKARKMVVIIDPHIKRDSNYFLHNDAESNNYYIKTKDGKDYEGWCWPGASSYLDLYNPAIRDYYQARYLLENFPGSTQDTHIWNDMNEPSVFNGPEVTAPKDLVHYGGWEHRDVHNTYGLVYTMITRAGLLQRSGGKLRPFILTRAHFAGTQRYAAVWTGDNMAEWSHLEATVPMCLSLSVAGISFCGADVGGFFRSPDAELITRWYQLAAYQPFFRSHAHIDTKRREPWLFDEQSLGLIRVALRERYALLPLWYTLFFEHERTGAPVMRPLWVEFPAEAASFAIDSEYLLGDSLLVRPVTRQGAAQVSVYLPGGKEQRWYDAHTHRAYVGGGAVSLAVTMDTIPVFQRGGTIVPKKERIRRASPLMHDDPYTLIVAPSSNGSASGTLYMDDEKSFEYRDGKYLYLSLKYNQNKLTSSKIDNTVYPTKSWLERVIILSVPKFTSAQLESSKLGKVSLDVIYNSDTQSLVIRKPGVNMGDNWSITLQ